MKILILTPSIPYPPHRGDKLRMYNIVKWLAKNNEITLLTFQKSDSENKYISELEKLGITLITVRLTRWQSKLNLFRSIFTRLPFHLAYYSSSEMKNELNRLMNRQKFDIVYFHLINILHYVDEVEKHDVIKVLDFTDAMSLYLSRFIESIKSPVKKLIYQMELKKVLKFEKKTAQFDTIFVCSEVDKKYLEEMNTHHNIKLFLNGFDPETFKIIDDVETEEGRIMFSGNIPYFPNRDAILYFVNDIFPRVLNKIPNAKLYIVGKDPTPEISELKSENVIITGFVEDIRKEYLKSEVNIVPIRYGAGTPNKITEALALGIPTVSTSLAISGLPENLKKYISTAESPEEFAEKIIDILNTVNKKETILNNGIDEVKETLGMNNVVGRVEAYLQERVSKSQLSQ